MLIIIFAYTIVLAIIFSLLEIQIEGENGWAKNLPTWRKKINILSEILDSLPITGYHFYMNLFVFLFFHFPILFIGWTLKLEFLIMGLFWLWSLLEDFFWFLFNPCFGLKNFKKGKIPWRTIWWWRLPRSYYINIILIIVFLFLGLKT